MFRSLIDIFAKLGLVAEGTVSPREFRGLPRVIVSTLAVAFSYFFVHVAFFGPPIAEIFKGAYILGIGVLSVIYFKGRQKPLREGFGWIDEIFNFLAIASMCSLLLMGGYWLLFHRIEAWNDFAGAGASVAGIIGFALGAFLYWNEANQEETSDAITLSDYLFVFSITSSVLWWAFNNVELQNQMGGPVPTLLVLSAGLITAVSMDIARRIVGPIIPLIGFLFLIYSFGPIAQAMPSLLNHQGYGVDRVAEFLVLQSDGLTGLIVEVFANFMIIFVVLGAFLEKTGLGRLFIDATYRLTGQRTGGPGLTAVVSSGFFGMISGSGVANVVTTGTFTIPLMKRVGYRPEFAAAVEAAASTGGAYMPPIMGAGAFLLAQFTEISYFEVIKIAAIPAVLYYLSVGYIVYIRAVSRGLHGVPVSELPAWGQILPRLHLLLPVPVMIYFLIIGDSAFLAAFKTICVILMLKTIDLLNTVRGPLNQSLVKPFLGASILFGVFSYFFGLTIGGPFAWFADTYRGINLGDALMWTLGGYIVLKLAEFVLTGVEGHSTTHAEENSEPFEMPSSGMDHISRSFVELIKAIWISLEAGAKNSLVVGCIAGVLGILLSCATQSDLPGRMSSLLIELSFGLLPLTIFWVIVAGYIVGMGLPIAASYVVLVIFGALSLTDLGVPTLAAHLICYWVAVVSAVTPPVALAAYAASAIALSDPVRTGFQALKLASWIFIMPFLFVYTPLLLNGSMFDIIITVAACLLGIVAWAGVMEGFLIRKTSGTELLLLFFASACLLMPVDHLITFITPLKGEFHYPVYLLGAAILVVSYFMQKTRVSEQLQPAEPVKT